MSGEMIEARGFLQDTTIPGLSRAEIARYSEVAGDNNPVHTDELLAKRLGLDDVPVQGMYVMALVSKYLEQWQHHNVMRKLHMRFVAPTVANRDIRITAKIMAVKKPEQTEVVRIMVYQRDILVAVGEAVVSFRTT